MPLHFGSRLPTSGQLPSLQSYTQFLLFFPNPNTQSSVPAENESSSTPETSSVPESSTKEKSLELELQLQLSKWRNEVLESLRTASRKVVTNFPWLGGKIGNTGHRYVLISLIYFTRDLWDC